MINRQPITLQKYASWNALSVDQQEKIINLMFERLNDGPGPQEITTLQGMLNDFHREFSRGDSVVRATQISADLTNMLKFPVDLEPGVIEALLEKIAIDNFRSLPAPALHNELLFLKTPQEILDWGVRLEAAKPQPSVTLYTSQLFSSYYEMDEAQIEALKTALTQSGATGLLLRADYKDLGRPRWPLTSEQWDWLGGLLKGFTHFGFEEHTLQFDKNNIDAFARAIKHISSLDFSLGVLASDASLEDAKALAQAMQHCKTIALSRTLMQTPEKIKQILCNIQPIKLDLVETDRHPDSLISILKDVEEPDNMMLRALSISLRKNGLDRLTDDDWIKIIEKLEYNTKHLDISENNLATLSGDRLITLFTRLRGFKSINLSGNGFEQCTDEKWKEFCDALRISRICYLEPMQTSLSSERKQQLEKILGMNSSQNSLKATVKFFKRFRLNQDKNQSIVLSEHNPTNPALDKEEQANSANVKLK